MGSGHPAPDILRKVLEDAPSLTAAALQLGISRPTLYRWMRRTGIKVERRQVALDDKS